MKTFFCKLRGPRPGFPGAMPARSLLEHEPVIEEALGFRFEMFPMPRGALHR